jgi:hypothetical protein
MCIPDIKAIFIICGCFSLLLFSKLADAQVIFSGKVINTDNFPIAGIHVTISHPKSFAIICFGFSDKEGKYIIPCKTNEDTLLIKVYALGHAAQEKLVPNRTQVNHFQLLEQSIS